MRKLQAVLIIASLMSWTVLYSAENRVVVIPRSTAKPAAENKLIFKTSGTWNGNLGGLSGADDKCNAEAKAQGFSGTFQALLGSAEGRPEHRSIHYPLPYVSVTGAHLNSDYHDLFASGVDNPVSTISQGVWTGLKYDGTLADDNCALWKSSWNLLYGSIGYSNSITTSWLGNGSRTPCDLKRHLYCIEQ